MARTSRQEQERIDAQAAREAELGESNFLDQIELIKALGFSNDEQLIKVEDALLKLDDEQEVENLCKTVFKQGGGEEGHQIPEMAMTRLQLLVYYAKHLDRTDRLRFMSIDTEHINLHMLTSFKDQKKLEKDRHKS